MRVRLATGYDCATLDMGASVACDGVCLTVVDKGNAEGNTEKNWFDVEISQETLNKTHLTAHWQPNAPVNLERALRLGDELGGHLVSGHIDGVAQVRTISPEGDSICARLACPPDITRFIAQKGSVTLNGVSLTINDIGADWFEVNIIPHTQNATSWGVVKAGDMVNLEVDTLARYIARLMDLRDVSSRGAS